MDSNFNYSLTTNGVTFNYLKSKSISERELHDYNELLFYIDGEATLHTENYKQKLTPNTLVFIPKGKYHFLSLSNPDNFTRLKISFDCGALTSQLPSDILVSKNLPTLTLSLLENALIGLKNDNFTNDFYYGAFLLLASWLSTSATSQVKFDGEDTLVSNCAKYIENNLSNDLSIAKISESLNFSPSTVSHVFKRQTGISIHNYIVQKRMIYAKKLLETKSPTQVHLECGYADYSSFYKAYVKMFGKSPKD